LGSSNREGLQIAHPSSAQQIAVANVAEGAAALPAAAHAISQPLAGPVAVDSLPAVDDDSRLAQGESGTVAVESDQGIAQPLGLCCPVRRRAGKPAREHGLERGERLAERADVAAPAKPQAKDRRGDDAVVPADGELQGHGPRTQEDVLAASRVEEDVLDIGEGGNEQPCAVGRWAVEGRGVKVQKGSPGLGQPDRLALPGGQRGINESRAVPTAPPRRGGPACG
jgi:hypothetical protein